DQHPAFSTTQCLAPQWFAADRGSAAGSAADPVATGDAGVPVRRAAVSDRDGAGDVLGSRNAVAVADRADTAEPRVCHRDDRVSAALPVRAVSAGGRFAVHPFLAGPLGGTLVDGGAGSAVVPV